MYNYNSKNAKLAREFRTSESYLREPISHNNENSKSTDGIVDLQQGSITSDLVAAPQIGNEELPRNEEDEPGPAVANDYPVSEDSG